MTHTQTTYLVRYETCKGYRQHTTTDLAAAVTLRLRFEAMGYEVSGNVPDTAPCKGCGEHTVTDWTGVPLHVTNGDAWCQAGPLRTITTATATLRYDTYTRG